MIYGAHPEAPFRWSGKALYKPRPVDVLPRRPVAAGGWLKAYRRDPDGWRGLVHYRDRVTLQHWLQWRGEAELRPAGRRPVGSTT